MEPDEVERELELRDYLAVLRRRVWVIVAAVVVTVGGAVAFSQLQTPLYAATADLLLQPRGSEVIFDQVTGQRVDATRSLQTEIRVIESRPVRARVYQTVPDAPDVSVSPIGQTDVVSLRVESPDPVLAQASANAYAQAYIDHRREADIADLTVAITELGRAISDLDVEIEASPEDEQAALLQARNALLEKRQDLVVSSRLRTGGAQIVQEALLPESPFSPQTARNAVLATVLGLMLGAGLAFLRDHFDDTIKTKEDLERATGLPVVGVIPDVGESEGGPVVVSIDDPNSSAAEAYRTLRTSVQFMALDRPLRVLQVTSPNAQEGKTTTVANIGVAVARAGRMVTLMCCDLRRPRLHHFFDFDSTVGFTSAMVGDTTLSASMKTVPSFSRLSVLPSGPVPPNPSELLGSQRATEVVSALNQDGRLLVIDSPPVLPVTDSLVVARWADATLLVCLAGHTRKGDVQRALEMLQRVGAPVVGTVLNGVKRGHRYSYNYRYYERYEADNQAAASAGKNGNGHQPAWAKRKAMRARRS